MAASDRISAVNSFVAKFPLEEILETTETVASMLPSPANTYIAMVGKALKVLIKLKPVANKSLDTAAAIANNTSELSHNVAALASVSPERQKFDSLLAIASSDGYISPEEKQFLHEKAVAAGIDEDEFECIILGVGSRLA